MELSTTTSTLLAGGGAAADDNFGGDAPLTLLLLHAASTREKGQKEARADVDLLDAHSHSSQLQPST